MNEDAGIVLTIFEARLAKNFPPGVGSRACQRYTCEEGGVEPTRELVQTLEIQVRRATEHWRPGDAAVEPNVQDVLSLRQLSVI